MYFIQGWWFWFTILGAILNNKFILYFAAIQVPSAPYLIFILFIGFLSSVFIDTLLFISCEKLKQRKISANGWMYNLSLRIKNFIDLHPHLIKIFIIFYRFVPMAREGVLLTASNNISTHTFLVYSIIGAMIFYTALVSMVYFMHFSP